MLNKVILMGRLTKDPEFRQTPSGQSVTRISIALNRSYVNKQSGEKVEDTTYVDCEAWGSTADFVSRYFRKGNMILIEGRLRNNNYTDKNGVNHYGMNVVVENVSFCESKGSGQQGGYDNGGYNGGNGGYNNGSNGGYNNGYNGGNGGYNNGYNNNGGGYQRPQSNGGNDMPGGYNQPPQQSAPQAPQNNNQPAKGSLSIGSLSEFEDILSDGELPF